MAKVPPRQEGWKHSFAGGVAGSCAVMILHPFDVIKTRLQVQDGHQSEHATYKGALDAAKVIYRREGWRAFYNGLTPSWLGSGVAWAAYFYAYEHIKGVYLSWNGGERLGTLWTTLSAAQAGAMVCLVTNPIWLIKTRLQLQQQHKPAMRSTQAAAAAAAVAVGQAGSAAATAPDARTTAAEAGRVTRAPASSSLSHPAQPAAQAGPGHAAGTSGAPNGGPVQRPAAAAAAAVASASSRQPATAHVPYRGMLDGLVRIAKEEGLRGYYKGLGPSLVLTCHGAIQFTVYEELKHLVGAWSRKLHKGQASAAAAAASPPAPEPSVSAAPADLLAPLPSRSLALSRASGERSTDVEPQSQGPAQPITSLETSVCAVLSKLSASVLTYPSQVVRSRLQQRFDNRDLVYKGSIETVVLTWRNEGLRGFYRGLGPALMRTLPLSALTLTLYEKVLQLLPASNR